MTEWYPCWHRQDFSLDCLDTNIIKTAQHHNDNQKNKYICDDVERPGRARDNERLLETCKVLRDKFCYIIREYHDHLVSH